MDKNINNIHDKYFKSLMSDREYAFYFFKTFLPQDTLEFINLNTLKLANKSFISIKLKESFADMVFEFEYKDNVEKGYITIVLEHKSKPEKQAFLQILNYTTEAYIQQIKDGQPLKTVISMVFYHGKEQWKLNKLTELIKYLPKKLKRYVPDFDVIFIDLGRFSDKQLLNIGNSFLTSALLTQKYSYNPSELIDKVEMIFETLFSDRKRNLNYSIFVYFMNLVNLREEKFKKLLENISEPIKKEIMSTLEMIEKKYKQEGIEISIVKLFKKGFNASQISDIMEMSIKKVKEILKKKNVL